MPDFLGYKSGICLSRINRQRLFHEICDIVDFFFCRDVGHYVKMEADDYRSIVAAAQDEMNRRNLVQRLAADQRAILERIIGSRSILAQSNLYLRATRPGPCVEENIGWHRETFYGLGMRSAVNFWMPIRNVTIDTTLRYIPDSHLVPDEDISTVSEDSATVRRFSPGHKIGLLYAPKTISSGIDLTRDAPLIVRPEDVAIFSGQLIHGAAANHSSAIRFSLDFRLIAEMNMPSIKDHFASGRPYFERI